MKKILKNKLVSLFKIKYSKLKISHVVGEKESPLLNLTIDKVFDQKCFDLNDKIAFVSKHQNEKLTWKELKFEVNSFAMGLKKLGFQKGF
jgi:fatty-acyl-CoA synthase